MSKKSESKKMKNKLHNLDEAYLINEIMIGFIGVCILILAFLSVTIGVPKEYAVGATIAGLLFVMSDMLLIHEKISSAGLMMYGLLLFFGVFSFIVLPVMLLNDNVLRETLMEYSDFYTIFALGLVLILTGNKTLIRKLKQQEENNIRVDELKEEFIKLAERHGESSELIDKIKSDFEKAQPETEEIIRTEK